MARTLPSLVSKLQVYDSWLVGSAADPNRIDPPRDFDVCVPHHRWFEAAPWISEFALAHVAHLFKPNTFGGWKIVYHDNTPAVSALVEVDVWPDHLERLLVSGHCDIAMHLMSRTVWRKV